MLKQNVGKARLSQNAGFYMLTLVFSGDGPISSIKVLFTQGRGVGCI